MNETEDRPAKPPAGNLRDFPARGLTICLCIFLAAVPLAYSPRGAEFDGLFDDFYYRPKLAVGLLLLAFAAVFHMLLLLQRRVTLRYNPVFLYAGAFLAALAVATALSPYPATAFWGRKFRSEGLLAFAMYGFAFFVFATSTDTARKVKTYLFALLAGAGLASAYGLAQFFGLELLPRDYIRAGWWRAFATSGNPDFLSAYLLLALPFPVLFFLLPEKEKNRLSWLWLALAALVFSCILATYHRGAWVGLGAGAVFAVVLLKRSARKGYGIRLRRIIVLAAAFLACALAVDRSAAAMSRPSLFERASAGTQVRWIGESTIQVRTYIWHATLPLIARRPAFGWGPDTMYFVFPEQAPAPKELGYSGRIGSTPDKPENLLLQVAYEGGLASLVPFLIVIGLFFKILWRAIPKLDGPAGLLAIGIAAGCLSHLAQQQFSFSTLASSPVFWSLLGLGLATARLAVKSTEPSI